MTKLVSTVDRPKIERHDVSRGIIETLITIGFGASLVAESDIGVNFAGLTYRECAMAWDRAKSTIQPTGGRTMTTQRS